MPDMDALARQMEDAMAEAQKAMKDLPAQMEEIQDVMGALSNLMEDLPAQMQGLDEVVSGLGDIQNANAQALIGEPDWSLRAAIQVGDVLHIAVDAEFDLQQVIQAWESAQGSELEALVGGLVQGTAGEDADPDVLSQVMGQLKQGRGMAAVRGVEILECPKCGCRDLRVVNAPVVWTRKYSTCIIRGRPPVTTLYETILFITASAAITALAVQQYRLEKGRLPDTLTDLVPEYLDSIPRDPFIDAPLKYKKTPTTFTIPWARSVLPRGSTCLWRNRWPTRRSSALI